jgi:hypothetical protein
MTETTLPMALAGLLAVLCLSLSRLPEQLARVKVKEALSGKRSNA